jgi:hypothetical protein
VWGNTVARKNHVGKHCSNPQCFLFKKKTTKLNYQPAQYEKKTKIDKDSSEKKNKEKRKKTIWGNTVAINSVLKKKLQN